MAIYKGENLLANSANSDALVRNPDFSNAVTVTPADLLAGYTCPDDGLIVVAANVVALSVTAYLTVNGVNVAISRRTNDYNSFMQCQVAVSKNDIVQVSSAIDTAATFVPYGLYTAPDTLVPHSYSQSEQFTGNYWIDGKKIYRKVVQVTEFRINSNTWGTLCAVPDNMRTLIHLELTTDTESSHPHARVTGSNIEAYALGVSTGVKYIQLEYTKTTG